MLYKTSRYDVSITSQGKVDGAQFQNVHDLHILKLQKTCAGLYSNTLGECIDATWTRL